MQLENPGQILAEILNGHVVNESRDWLEEKIKLIVSNQSAKDLYLTYSLIPSKIDLVANLNLSPSNSDLEKYLVVQSANSHQIARIYLLSRVLEANKTFFTSKVAKIIEVADTSEMETFLKFLIVLPNAEDFKASAVEALRTNISTVFNAIAYNNPYPSLFFDDHQWNQMYLKTAFMQGDLGAISDIDKRANEDLARIISDYAHERWAAGREIDPDFWRPIPKFIGSSLLKDMERLLGSENPFENRAGALCCYYSENPAAKELLRGQEKLLQQIEDKELSWETLKEA
ncbi:MAG: EboA domain-containing protein [Maribacter sp.]|uniref:EboA domain-containing protein n=1 Tax=Maribacter sp. TaxID=1897614 RepID=UPI00329938C0